MHVDDKKVYSLNEMDAAKKKSFSDGKTHRTPSDDTKIFMKNMDEKFNNVKDSMHKMETNFIEKIGDVHTGISDLKTDLVSAINSAIAKVNEDSETKIDKIKAECDKKYAPAWVAIALKFVIGAVSLIVIKYLFKDLV